MALQGLDRASVVIIIQPETAPAVRFHREIAAGHAEIVVARRIDVKRGTTLAKQQARGACAVFQREIVKLEHRVFFEEGHGAIFEFDFRPPLVRGKDVPLADGQVQFGALPSCLGAGQRVAMRLPGEADITLNEAQADDASMARIRSDRLNSSPKRTEQDQQQGRDQFTENHVYPLTGTLPKSLDVAKNRQVSCLVP